MYLTVNALDIFLKIVILPTFPNKDKIKTENNNKKIIFVF